MDAQTVAEVVTLLEKLANGDTVALGEFDDSGLLGDDPAGQQAEVIREIADMLRAANIPAPFDCGKCRVEFHVTPVTHKDGTCAEHGEHTWDDPFKEEA